VSASVFLLPMHPLKQLHTDEGRQHSVSQLFSPVKKRAPRALCAVVSLLAERIRCKGSRLLYLLDDTIASGQLTTYLGIRHTPASPFSIGDNNKNMQQLIVFDLLLQYVKNKALQRLDCS
jgi:hypothetical protein